MSKKHFIHISDYTGDELWEILKLAKDVKAKFRSRKDFNHFNNKSLEERLEEREIADNSFKSIINENDDKTLLVSFLK